jgi:hypothetical protein
MALQWKSIPAAQGVGTAMAIHLWDWLHRRRVKAEFASPGRHVEARRVTNPFHAVSIVAGPGCRATAEKYGGRRFLSTEVPRIPQPTCDRHNCGCRYQHHEDRRTGVERRHRDVWDRNSVLLNSGDRRRSHGRRSTDP